MNKYSSYTNAELEEHLSNYLIDSWSYSKVASFSRNEKEFEKREIYRERSRSSSSTVAGNAYHSALEYFFMELQCKGQIIPITEMERVAFSYIEEVHPE